MVVKKKKKKKEKGSLLRKEVLLKVDLLVQAGTATYTSDLQCTEHLYIYACPGVWGFWRCEWIAS